MKQIGPKGPGLIRRLRRLVFMAGILLLLVALVRIQLPPVRAINNLYTTVQSGQATDSSSNIIANYGSSTQYQYNAPSTQTLLQFFSGLESHTADVNSESICNLHITLSGTDPNGVALAGAGFTSLDVKVGPQSSSGNTSVNLLDLIYAVLKTKLPAVISNLVDFVISWAPSSPPAATGSDTTTAWGDWTDPSAQCANVRSFDTQDKSMLFTWNFGIGSKVQGTYTIKVTYVVTWSVCSQLLNGACYQAYQKTGTLTDTVYYCYVECNNDFTLSANPSALTVNAGSTGSTSTINLASQASFSQSISLTASSTDSFLQISLNPGTDTLSSKGTASSTLTVSDSNVCDTGGTSVTVSGSSTYGTMTSTHSISIPISIVPGQCISITSNPSSLTIPQGTASSSQITLSTQGTFSGSLGLSATVTGGPSGTCPGVNCPIAQISPGTVTLTSPGTATATLTVTTGSGTPSGSYTVTISASAPGMTNTATVPASVVIQDYTISSSPDSLSLTPGGAASSTINLASVNSFSGTVGLGTAVSPSGIFVGLNPQNVVLQAGGTGTSTLAISSSSSTAIGTYHVAITAISGSIVHTITVTVNVYGDFGISSSSLNPTSINPGDSTTSTITATSMGLTGGITLSASVTPPNGVNCGTANCPTMSFNPGTISLTSGGSGTSTMTVATPSSITPGTYGITITGVSGSLSHATTVTLQVQQFSISASPTALNLTPGVSGSSTITISSNGGFVGSVGLSVSALPGLSCSLSSTSVSNGAGTSVLSCSSNSVGTYIPAVTGTSGSFSLSVWVQFAVQDFSISASPNPLTFLAGSSGTGSVTVTGLSGFSGTVSLTTSTQSGLTCSLNPASLLLSSATYTASSTLSCSGSVGSYTATFNGASGPLTHNVAISVTVQPDFTIAGSTPNPQYFSPGGGSSSTISLSSLGFTGTVSLTTTVSCGGSSCPAAILSSPSVALSSGGQGTVTLALSTTTSTFPYTYSVTVTGTSGSVTHSVTLTFIVLFNFVDNFNGTLAPGWTPCPGSSPPIYAVDFTGLTMQNNGQSGGGLCYPNIPAKVDGWTVSTQVRAVAGNYATIQLSAITLTPSYTNYTWVANGRSSQYEFYLNGFLVYHTGGYVPGFNVWHTLAINDGAGVLSLIIDGRVTIVLGGINYPQSLYWVELRPGWNSIENFRYMTIKQVNPSHADFTIVTSPTTWTIPAGSTAFSPISTSSTGLFSGTVSLSSQVTGGAGLNCNLNPSTVGLSNYATDATSNISCVGSGGTYTVIVTGTSGSLSESTILLIYVQDFAISASPSSVTVPAGISGGSTITVSSLGNYAGTVTLTLAASPTSGMTCSLSNTSLSNSVGTSNLICQGSANIYTVTVTGTSGSFSHQLNIQYTIQDFTISANPTSVNILMNTAGTSVITIGSLFGFAGQVSLSATVSPSSGVSCSFNPYYLYGAGNSNLSCSGSPGTYTVTVNGMSGSLVHTTQITFIVKGFTVNVTPSSLSTPEGRTVTASVIMNSVNGYSGSVSLAASIYCASYSLGSTALQIPSSGSTSTSISITASTNCTASTWSGSVTATDASLGISAYGSFTLTTSDFTIYADFITFGIKNGGSMSLNIHYGSNNGYSGTPSQTMQFPAPYCCLSFGWQGSVNLASGGSAIDPLTVAASGTGIYDNVPFVVSATDGYITRTITLQISINDYYAYAYNNPATAYIGGGGGAFIQIFPYFGIPLTNSTFVFSPTSDPCVTVGQSVNYPKYFNIGPVQPYLFPAVAITASSSCTANEIVQATVTITGVNTNLYNKAITFTIQVLPKPTGGGGSIAHGSLITMADGSKVPVQNLKVGDQMLGYDPITGKYTISIVKSITIVDCTNMLIIHTSAGTPFRVDANPHQTLWAKSLDGTIGWTPVTKIRPGYELFTPNGWVTVTSIGFAPSGRHVMYDIIATAPYFADGYLDPIYKT